jgi:hypothetical protein
MKLSSPPSPSFNVRNNPARNGTDFLKTHTSNDTSTTVIKTIEAIFNTLLASDQFGNEPSLWLTMLEQKIGKGEMPRNLNGLLNGYKTQIQNKPTDIDTHYLLFRQLRDTVFPITKIDRDATTYQTGLSTDNLVTPKGLVNFS